MSEFKNIKFKVELPYVVRLLKDEPEEKKGKYGMFQEYTVEYEGEEYKFIAAEGLHNSLLEYKKGDLVEIMKIKDSDDKSHFEVEALSEEDIKSAGGTEEPELQEMPNQPNWDKINADKQHAITIAIAMKLAVQSLLAKAKLSEKDYEEIEVRMVKFKATMEKYLGVVMPAQVSAPKFSPLVQEKWDEFDKYLNENKFKIESYSKVRAWLDNLKDPTTKVLTEQLAKLKESLEPSGEYKSYHKSLITTCCDTLKTEDQLPVIQTLTNMVKKWDIKGLEKLSDTTENQCLNLLEEFDKQQVEEDSDGLPF